MALQKLKLVLFLNHYIERENIRNMLQGLAEF